MLRSRRVIPNRTVNRAVTPIEGPQGRKPDRNPTTGEVANSGAPLVDVSENCRAKRKTHKHICARYSVEEKETSYAGSCVLSHASYIRREKLAAELKAQKAIMELEKKLILKQLEVEKADLDQLAEGNRDCDDQASSEAAGPTKFEAT